MFKAEDRIKEVLSKYEGEKNTAELRLQIEDDIINLLSASNITNFNVSIAQDKNDYSKLNIQVEEIATDKEVHIKYNDSKSLDIHYNAMKNMLQNSYGDKIGLFLTNRLAKAIRKVKDNCIDNIRIANSHSCIELVKYYEQKQQGCCGFCDFEVTFTHKLFGKIPYRKTTYMVGFNYGR